MNPLFILGHLGLGDHLLCNGLVRWLAARHSSIHLPCYAHNDQAVSFMFRDLPNVHVSAVVGDREAVESAAAFDEEVLRLGYYGGVGFAPEIFDREFYRQAGVPFSERWDSFKVPFVFTTEKRVWGGPYLFLHDDKARGFEITRRTEGGPDMFLGPIKDGAFFENIPDLTSAAEVHCINSSFLILWDSMPHVEGQKLFLHHYARPTAFPTLRKPWQVLS